MANLYENIINNYNLIKTDTSLNTTKVPYIPDYGSDAEGNKYITYTFFKSQSDVSSADQYSSSSEEYTDFVTNYNQTNEDAAFGIINDGLYWSASFSNVVKINFVQPSTIGSSDKGIITFGQLTNQYSEWDEPNEQGRAAATFQYVSQQDQSLNQVLSQLHGDIWFNVDHSGSANGLIPNKNIWTDFGAIEQGTYAYKTIYEEISHALGIDFLQGNGLALPMDESTQKYTITSYAPYGYISAGINNLPVEDADPLSVILYGEDNDGDGAQDVLSAYGLQLYDIAALQELYGRDYLARTNDDNYQLDQGLGRSGDVSKAFIYTIWDGAGDDTLDASDFDTYSAKLDLRQGAFISIGTDGKNGALFEWSVDANGIIQTAIDAGNVAIAYHSVIENAVGTSNNDILIGNAWGNVLRGLDGNDYLYGSGVQYDGAEGFTDVDSSDQNDPNRNKPTSDNDELHGGAGDDTIFGGLGYDKIFGGTENDTLTFERYSERVIVTFTDAHSGWVRKFSGNDSTSDSFSEIETIIGTQISDGFSIKGSASPDNLFGLAGDDVFFVNGPINQSLVFDGGTDNDVVYLQGLSEADFIKTSATEFMYTSITDLSTTFEFYDVEDVIFGADSIAFAGTWAGQSSGSFLSVDNETYIAPLSVAGTYNSDMSEKDSYFASSSKVGDASSGSVTSSVGGAYVSWELHKGSPPSTGGSPDTVATNGLIYDRITINAPDGGVGFTEFSAVINDNVSGFFGFTNAGGLQGSGVSHYFDVSGSNLQLNINGQWYDYNENLSHVVQNPWSRSLHSTSWLGNHTSEYMFRFSGAQVEFDFFLGTIRGTGHTGFDSGSAYSGYGRVDLDFILPSGASLESDSGAFGSGIGAELDDFLPEWTGTENDEKFAGSDFNEIISGLGGNDVLIAGAGNDELFGGSGDDTYVFNVGDGNNTITEESGFDVLELGAGIDLADIIFTRIGDDLDVQIASGFLIKDFYAGNLVEQIAFADGSTFDLTTLLVVDDTFTGTSAVETFDGGTGSDTVDYSAGLAVNIDLQNNIVSGGYAEGDTLISVENIIGSESSDSAQRDWIWGDANANHIQGMDGADILEGGAGSDIIDGGDGWDYSRYTRSDAAVTINLTTGVNTGGHAEGDVIFNVEAIIGSAFDDVITGGDNGDYLKGENGNDTLNGGLANDQLFGGEGNDTYLYGSGRDTIHEQGAGVDRVVFDVSKSPLAATISGNTIIFTAGVDELIFNSISLVETFAFDGYADMTLGELTALISGVTDPGTTGDDILIGTSLVQNFDGFDGNDTVDYSASLLAVNIDMVAGAGVSGDSAGDVYVSIENIIGSDNFAERDWIWGDDQANHIQGMDGADILEGGAGADIIDGGLGWDYSRYLRSDAGININLETGVNTGGHAEGDVLTGIEAIVGSAYNDTIRGGDSNDYLKGEGGDDEITGGAGIDQLYGGDGSDTFIFEALTAFSHVDKIRDFDVSEGDIIDISDLLSGYDPLADAITDFVEITDNGTDSTLSVDANGGADSFVQVATIYGTIGLTDEDALETSGNLMAA